MINPSEEAIKKREKSFRALQEQFKGNETTQHNFLKAIAEAYEYQVSLRRWWEQEYREVRKELERLEKGE